ncbi:MAG TPA: SusC/RagA family TonB-linked outer membrane protein [Gemmatimonadales bacterium]|nr:SusC/RagA family TonB-linked outer membrane protein [Gemmatimonadales bacterium]
MRGQIIMNNSTLRLLRAAGVLAGLVVGNARAGAAQQGTVGGTVVDQANQRPVVGAQVYIAGSTRRVFTDQKGAFVLDKVPAGEVEVRVRMIGYATAAKKVTVGVDQRTPADIALTASAISLDEVVVTATGAQSVREQGNAISNLDAPKIMAEAPVTNAADLLNSRTPGLLVQPGGGTSGTGARIRIRGANSLSLSNEPVIIVDGIRVENGASSNSIGVGGQVPSRINDINPDDIESVEVVKGPSAAVLYGTDAANGVIVYKTKRGRPGKTKWEVFSEGGSINDETNWPTNFKSLRAPVDSGKQCLLSSIAAKTCTQTELLAFNPLVTNSPFRTGSRQEYGVSASGGTDQTTFYVAGNYSKELGVYQTSNVRQVSVRANVHDQARDNLSLNASAGYTNGRLRLPQNDNNSFGVVSSGLLGRADTINQGYGFLTPAQSYSILTLQDVDRFTGSVESNYRPWTFLEARVVAGTDFTSRYDQNTIFPGNIPISAQAFKGSRNADPFQIYNWTANASLTASFLLNPNVSSATTVGLQYYHDRFHGILASGQQLAAGTNSLTGIVTPADSETSQEFVTYGRFAEERVGIHERLFFTAAVRNDNSSAFGVQFKNIYYPKFSTSWVLSEEPFFPRIDWLNSLRLRGAWGESGLHPGPIDALQYFLPQAVTVSAADVPGITQGDTLGNNRLKPERTTEVELGFDADALARAVHFEFTYYDKTSHDALIARRLAPTLGTSLAEFENIGSVSNKGVEIVATAQVVNRPNVEWSITATAWGNKNRVVDLGPGISPIIFGLGGFSQRFQAGYPAGSYFMVPYTYSDVNGDGLLSKAEVTPGTQAVFLGSPFPDHGGTVSTELNLGHRVSLYGLLDGRFGNKLFNSTEQFRCGFLNCQAVNDPKSSLADQAAAVANAFYATQAGYIEDGGFVKLREVSVTLYAPDEWAKKIGGTALRLTLSGRNLVTWTNYKGFDPELNEAGQANFTTADFLTQPPVRYFLARLDVTF